LLVTQLHLDSPTRQTIYRNWNTNKGEGSPELQTQDSI